MNDVVERGSDDLTNLIRRAISDPGAFVGARVNNGFVYEAMTKWQARAVLAALADASPDIGKEGIGNDVR